MGFIHAEPVFKAYKTHILYEPGSSSKTPVFFHWVLEALGNYDVILLILMWDTHSFILLLHYDDININLLLAPPKMLQCWNLWEILRFFFHQQRGNSKELLPEKALKSRVKYTNLQKSRIPRLNKPCPREVRYNSFPRFTRLSAKLPSGMPRPKTNNCYHSSALAANVKRMASDLEGFPAYRCLFKWCILRTGCLRMPFRNTQG